MSENKNLPPDLDARILAEAAFGASTPEIVMAISPQGAPEDHGVILQRVDTLVQAGKLSPFTYTRLDGRQEACLMANFGSAVGGVAA